MMKLRARINNKTNDIALFEDRMTVPFGYLKNCEVCHVFQSECDQLREYIAYRIEGDMSLTEMLAQVRAGYEAYYKDLASEYNLENSADMAVERAFEYSPDLQNEVDADDLRVGLFA